MDTPPWPPFFSFLSFIFLVMNTIQFTSSHHQHHFILLLLGGYNGHLAKSGSSINENGIKLLQIQVLLLSNDDDIKENFVI